MESQVKDFSLLTKSLLGVTEARQSRKSLGSTMQNQIAGCGKIM